MKLQIDLSDIGTSVLPGVHGNITGRQRDVCSQDLWPHRSESHQKGADTHEGRVGEGLKAQVTVTHSQIMLPQGLTLSSATTAVKPHIGPEAPGHRIYIIITRCVNWKGWITLHIGP